MQPNKFMGWVIWAIMAIVFYTLTYQAMKFSFPEENPVDPTFRSLFESEIRKINALLPVDVDDHTIMVGAYVHGTTIQYDYTLKHVRAADVTGIIDYAEVKRELQEKLCADEGAIQMLSLGFSFSYNYTSVDGGKLYAAKFPPNTCTRQG